MRFNVKLSIFQGPGSLPVRSQAGFPGWPVRPQRSQSGIGPQIVLSIKSCVFLECWLKRTNLLLSCYSLTLQTFLVIVLVLGSRRTICAMLLRSSPHYSPLVVAVAEFWDSLLLFFSFFGSFQIAILR